jgi:ferric-dicitrate binding protein FerR (iron transport regulator)
VADESNMRLQSFARPAPRVVPGLFAHEREAQSGSAFGARAATGSWRRQRWALAGAAFVGVCLLWLGSALLAHLELRAQENARMHPIPVPAPPLPPPAPVRFADGSTAQLHGTASTLFTEEMSSERVRLRLAGGARFDVVPNRERSFIVANAQVVVRVLGTAFSVDPEGLRTRVTVERGRVQVMWRSGATILSAGETALFPPENEPAFAPAGPFTLSETTPADVPAKHKSKRKQAHANKAKLIRR